MCNFLSFLTLKFHFTLYISIQVCIKKSYPNSKKCFIKKSTYHAINVYHQLRVTQVYLYNMLLLYYIMRLKFELHLEFLYS